MADAPTKGRHKHRKRGQQRTQTQGTAADLSLWADEAEDAGKIVGFLKKDKAHQEAHRVNVDFLSRASGGDAHIDEAHPPPPLAHQDEAALRDLESREGKAAARDRRGRPTSEQVEIASDMFWKHDVDVSATIDKDEYLGMMEGVAKRALSVDTREYMEAAFERADVDNSGELDFKEFVRSKTLVGHLAQTLQPPSSSIEPPPDQLAGACSSQVSSQVDAPLGRQSSSGGLSRGASGGGMGGGSSREPNSGPSREPSAGGRHTPNTGHRHKHSRSSRSPLPGSAAELGQSRRSHARGKHHSGEGATQRAHREHYHQSHGQHRHRSRHRRRSREDVKEGERHLEQVVQA